MRKGFWILILMGTFAACNDSSTAPSVKEDSIGREPDEAGGKIEKKTEAVGDSVKAVYNGIKENVQARLDSIERAHRDTTD